MSVHFTLHYPLQYLIQALGGRDEASLILFGVYPNCSGIQTERNIQVGCRKRMKRMVNSRSTVASSHDKDVSVLRT